MPWPHGRPRPCVRQTCLRPGSGPVMKPRTLRRCDLPLFRRGGERHRRSFRLSPLPARPRGAGDLPVHPHAPAYWQPFSADELRRAELAPPLPFTKGMPVLQIPLLNTSPMCNNYGPGVLLEHETRLYDLETDPGQLDRQESGLSATLRDALLMTGRGGCPPLVRRYMLSAT